MLELRGLRFCKRLKRQKASCGWIDAQPGSTDDTLQEMPEAGAPRQRLAHLNSGTTVEPTPADGCHPRVAVPGGRRVADPPGLRPELDRTSVRQALRDRPLCPPAESVGG